MLHMLVLDVIKRTYHYEQGGGGVGRGISGRNDPQNQNPAELTLF